MEGVPALPGLGEEAQAGPFGELGEHVARLDVEHGREVASCPVASGLAGHDAGDLVPSGVGPGLAGTGRLVPASAGKRGGPVRRRGEDGDQHPGDPAAVGPVLVAEVIPGGRAFHLPGLSRARRAGSRPATTARPIRPVSSGSAETSMPRAVKTCSRAAATAAVKLARSGRCPGRSGRGGHRHPEQLVDGRQCAQFLLGSGPVAGAEHVPPSRVCRRAR